MSQNEKYPIEPKSEVILHGVLRVVVLLAIFGSIALLILNQDAKADDVAFNLLAYVISITALVLTTFQSISVARQTRLTRYASIKVQKSIDQLDALVAADKQLARAVLHDTELEERIVAALLEHDVGDSHSDRTQIAKTVRQHVKKHLVTHQTDD